MIHGSCLCGQIKYELAGGVELINNCHCTMCRKAHGAAFGSFLHAASSGFRWTAGEGLIERYESSPGSLRAFCRVCGSNMPVLEDGGEVNIPAGTLDDDPGVRPIVHIFVGSKAPWFEIEDALPKFDQFPPREFWDSVTSNLS
ncbi:MAG TPA: GFA family protein [Bauldia sp.]|nr:GFA family protein [Bauldia sp.]